MLIMTSHLFFCDAVFFPGFPIGGVIEHHRLKPVQSRRAAPDHRRLLQQFVLVSLEEELPADRFIRYLGNRKVVFLTHTGEENDKRDFIAGLKEELSRAHIAYSEIRFGNDLNLLNQDSILAGASGIVFVPTSAKKKVLSLIVAPIEALKENRADLDVALFGYPEWLTQVPEYLNEFYKLNTYLYSRFYANPFDEDTKAFHKRFLYWYNKDMINASPQYALLGFDTGIYFLSAIRANGKNFASQQLTSSSDRIQTDFSFQRINHWSGFINKSFYFVNFAPDFTIKKIRE